MADPSCNHHVDAALVALAAEAKPHVVDKSGGNQYEHDAFNEKRYWNDIWEEASNVRSFHRGISITLWIVAGLFGAILLGLACSPVSGTLIAAYISFVCCAVITPSVLYNLRQADVVRTLTWYKIVKMSPSEGREYARALFDLHKTELIWFELNRLVKQPWNKV